MLPLHAIALAVFTLSPPFLLDVLQRANICRSFHRFEFLACDGAWCLLLTWSSWLPSGLACISLSLPLVCNLLGSFQYITKTSINQMNIQCTYICYVVNFFLAQAVFVFVLFLGMLMCTNKIETKEK